jgi:hypothetical protein
MLIATKKVIVWTSVQRVVSTTIFVVFIAILVVVVIVLTDFLIPMSEIVKVAIALYDYFRQTQKNTNGGGAVGVFWGCD